MSTKPLDVWNGLNERQREYLKAIYETDQEAERAERSRWNRGGRSRPADVWRELKYATTIAGNTALKDRIQTAGLVDQGTGSTFEALAARQLIKVRSFGVRAFGQIEQVVYVRLTTFGRKVARAGLGEQAPKKLPVGTLQEWHWRALALIYKQYATGQPEHIDGYTSRIGWNTWLRLRDYKTGSLMKEKEGYHITPFGVEYYEREYARYRELYPSVEAVEPKEAK